MFFKPSLSIAIISLFLAAAVPSAKAQTTVYQCGSGASITYSEKPCVGGRIVNTDDAPVPQPPKQKDNKVQDARRLEHNKALAQAMKPNAGESAEQFEKRRRRAAMMDADSAECARLDKRIPVEEASLTNPDKAEVEKAEAALVISRARFAKLGC